MCLCAIVRLLVFLCRAGLIVVHRLLPNVAPTLKLVMYALVMYAQDQVELVYAQEQGELVYAREQGE